MATLFFVRLSEAERQKLAQTAFAAHCWKVAPEHPEVSLRGMFGLIGKTRELILKERGLSGSLRQRFLEASVRELNSEEIESARLRMHFSLESYLSEQLPEPLLRELEALLWLQPKLALEYVGRGDSGLQSPAASVELRPGAPLLLDIPGGQRLYSWRLHDAAHVFAAPSIADRFQHLRQWLDDDEAHLVLSLGSGGVRGLSLPLVFKFFELLGLRHRLDEIWGCSIGAIYGYAYAIGVPTEVLNQRVFDLFNERYRYFFLKRSLLMTSLNIARHQWARLANSLGVFRQRSTTIQDELRRFIADVTRIRPDDATAIPFYAQATNLSRHGIYGLGEVPRGGDFSDVLVEADPVAALVASAAIPFVIGPTGLSEGANHDLWLDGAIFERTPLMLPFRKWKLASRLEALAAGQRRLKIFYVDLGDNLSVRRLKNGLNRLPLLGAELVGAMELVTTLGDMRFNEHLKLLQDLQEVDVLGLCLEGPSGNPLALGSIPEAIRKSRARFPAQLDLLEAQLRARSEGASAEGDALASRMRHQGSA